MKTILVCLVAMISLSALAGPSPRDVTEGEHIYLIIQRVKAGDTDIRERMKKQGMSDDAIARFEAHAATVEQQLAELRGEKYREICTNREKYENDTEALAQALEKVEQIDRDSIDTVAQRYRDSLSDVDRIAFDTLLTYGSAQAYEYLNSQAIRDGMDIAPFLNSVCRD